MLSAINAGGKIQREIGKERPTALSLVTLPMPRCLAEAAAIGAPMAARLILLGFLFTIAMTRSSAER